MIRSAIILLFFGAATGSAQAHDHWIRHGGYMVPVTAPAYAGPTQCCGKNDCSVVDPDDVSLIGTSYVIRSLAEVIPWSEVKFSPDGQFWRCQNNNDGKRKCFFAPQPSS